MFIQTKVQAHRMHLVLGLLGVNVGELHGSLSQAQVYCYFTFSQDRTIAVDGDIKPQTK